MSERVWGRAPRRSKPGAARFRREGTRYEAVVHW
jgi:hypothetical protein